MTNKDSKEVYENIQMKFIDSCKFMPSNLTDLASDLDDNQC